MSRFLSKEAAALEPYTPGEQPKGGRLIKLNTNESPYPPAPGVIEALKNADAGLLRLYSDPDCTALREAAAEFYGVKPGSILAGNGSDEVLSFAFRAFCGEGRPLAFADITYGFYKVWAALWGIEYVTVALREDLSLCVDDYMDFPGTVLMANPNAPTSLLNPLSEIRRLLESDRQRLVIVDEAYIDFGGESCVPLIREYDNLLVVQTLSKSRSLAGGRIGLAIGCEELIADINRIKYSFNPYNVNRLSALAAAAAMADRAYLEECSRKIVVARDYATAELRRLGFEVNDSKTNFIFAQSRRISGEEYCAALREKGILVRRFSTPEKIANYCRISIGSMEDMEALVAATAEILEGR